MDHGPLGSTRPHKETADRGKGQHNAMASSGQGEGAKRLQTIRKRGMQDLDQNKTALWTSSCLRAENDQTKVCDKCAALRLGQSQRACQLKLLHQETPPHWDKKSRRLYPHACDQVLGQISAIGRWRTQTARQAQWHGVLQPIPSSSHLLAGSSVSTSK